jgi:hypothetical protein
MQFTLSYSAKLDLRTRHKKCRDKRECDRINAILLFAADWSIDKVSQALLKHLSSIIRHLNDYTSSKKTTSDNGASEGRLTDGQTRQVIKPTVSTPIFICMKKYVAT